MISSQPFIYMLLCEAHECSSCDANMHRTRTIHPAQGADLDGPSC